MALLALMVRAFLLVVLVDTFRRDIILYHLSLPFISIVYLSPLRTIYVLYLGILASSRLLSTLEVTGVNWKVKCPGLLVYLSVYVYRPQSHQKQDQNYD